MARSKSFKIPRTHLDLARLEDRSIPSAAATYASPYSIGLAEGQTGSISVYNSDGSLNYQVADPYGANFTGGVNVVLADVVGDSVPDLITAPASNAAPTIYVYNGATQKLVDSFLAFESTFTGGVNIAAADFTGDGHADIVAGANQGGSPRVVIFDGASVAAGASSPTILDNFLAIDDSNFRGGVRLATGDLNGDGVPDLAVAAGFGGGPRVAAYDGAALGNGQQVKLFNDIYVFESSLRNGVYLSIGDLSGDGYNDLIFGAGPGGAPQILALDGKSLLSGQVDVLANFYAGSPVSRDGVEVQAVETGQGQAEIEGTDPSSGSVALFGSTGSQLGLLGNNGNQAIWQSPTRMSPSEIEGVYTGSGEGVLKTDGEAVDSIANASLSLDITGTPDSTSADGLTLSFTLTVTISGMPPLTVPFGSLSFSNSGLLDDPIFFGMETPSRVVPGPPLTTASLEASLSGGTITINQLGMFVNNYQFTIGSSSSPSQTTGVIQLTKQEVALPAS